MKPRMQCPLDKSKTDRLFKISLIIANFAFFSALLLYAVRGLNSRYMADDYCISAIYKQMGLFQGTALSYISWSNRFSAFLLTGFTEVFGENSIRFLPLLMIFGLTFVLSRIFRIVLGKLEILKKEYSSILLAQIVVFFSLLTAPNLFQSVYWRAGSISYFAPFIFLSLTYLFLLKYSTKKTRLLPALLLLILSFFSAGLSESFAALHLVFWLMVMLFNLIFIKNKSAMIYSTILILSSVAAVIVMVLAPGNTVRMGFVEQAGSFWTVLSLSFRHAFDFIVYSFRGLPVPLSICFISVFILGYHLTGHKKPKISNKIWLFIISGTILVSIFLIASVAAPTAFAMQAYPENRVWMLGRMILFLSVVINGFIVE